MVANRQPTIFTMVASDQRLLTHHRRTGPDTWAPQTCGPGETVALSLGIALAVDALYRMVDLP